MLVEVNFTKVEDMNTINPQEFGLPVRTVIEFTDESTIAIVINRKSRIIMSDGRRVAEKAEKIKKAQPQMNVALKTTAPVCSQTRSYLNWEGIDVIEIL